VGRNASLLLLTLAAAAGNYARTTLGPLQETMRAALALSDNQIAILQGPVLGVPMLLAALPLGLLIDRYSRTRLIVILALSNFTANLLTALASGFAWLIVMRAVVGLTTFAIFPVAISLLADLYPPAQRGRATMVMALGQVGGMSAAFAAGGLLLTMGASHADGWRWVVLWMTSPLFLVLCVLPLMREPARTEQVAADLPVAQSFKQLWQFRRVIVPLIAASGTVQIAEGAALTWAAPMLSRNFAVPPDRVGTIMALALLVSGILGPLGGGVLADLCHRSGGPRRTASTQVILALLCIPAALFAVVPSMAWASALLILFMALGGMTSVMVTPLMTILLPNELRGLCMTTVLAVCLLLGLGVAPLTVSLLSASLGGPAKIGLALSAVCMVTGALAAGMFLFSLRHLQAP
jgi:MFS family permease